MSDDVRERLLMLAKGLTSEQAGFADRPTVGWTVDQVAVATDGASPRHSWATVTTDGSDHVGTILGRSEETAAAALDRMRGGR